MTVSLPVKILIDWIMASVVTGARRLFHLPLYETENGKVAYNRPILNVTLGGTIANLTSRTYFDGKLNGSTSLDSATIGNYYATWQSSDGNGTYTHYGVATVTAIDSSRPNHS